MKSTCQTARYAASADTTATASFTAATALGTAIALRTGIPKQHRRNQQQIHPPLPPQCSSSHQKNQHEPHPPPPGVKISRISPACTSTVFLPPR
ncbi:hypothetical protein OIU74_003517 [Salix koriyanagi]|uniref:Uncharacterized protein n=1 Tax=Salix koriyanagi TaxID=2511006 RepID=A0A9Q0UYF7_9ROSI|nr:hypothetical protein OIU74_003517 [Salix koriyanagi]